MRDIKFRALTYNWQWMYYTLNDLVMGDAITHIDLEFKPESWSQYTGLKDINGVEIYEGDIVSLWYAPQATAKGRIKFENGGFYFKTTEAKPNIELAYNCVYEHGNTYTVIGNIHENPELLEKTK